MDFLDPDKQRAHIRRLIAGYILIGVAILIGTMILLYQAYGFGLDKDGQVIQNGLVFISSSPDGSEIYLNGKLSKARTGAKLQLPAGDFDTRIQRTGYNTWNRKIVVEGGGVLHFDYPKLFPAKLTTVNMKEYASAPGFASQSPDRRWLVVSQLESSVNFDLYDLSDPKKVTESMATIALPESVVSNAKVGAHSYKLAEWSTNNRHVLLQHTYVVGTSTGMDYVLLDRLNPTESVNLTSRLGLKPGQELSLRDKKFDRFYIFDPVAHTISTANLGDGSVITPFMDRVLAYKSYGADMMLYVTDVPVASADTSATADKPAAADTPLTPGKVMVALRDDGRSYPIRELDAAGPFLIDMAEYKNQWFVGVGASSENKVYVYKNPQRVRKSSTTTVLVPVQILRADKPNLIKFSSNTQFIMIENGTQFAVYDAEYDKGYKFISSKPIDAPQAYAAWMDGHRLNYVSGGQLYVTEYDNINSRTLVPANPAYLPFFDRDYDTVYTLASAGAVGSATVLTQTSLLTPEDK